MFLSTQESSNEFHTQMRRRVAWFADHRLESIRATAAGRRVCIWLRRSAKLCGWRGVNVAPIEQCSSGRYRHRAVGQRNTRCRSAHRCGYVGSTDTRSADSSDGCSWPASYRMPIPTTWSSGYYQASMSTSGSAGACQELAVLHRSLAASRKRLKDPAAIVHQYLQRVYQLGWTQPTLTMIAMGYKDIISLPPPQTSQFKNWELPFVQWAESKGYGSPCSRQ